MPNRQARSPFPSLIAVVLSALGACDGAPVAVHVTRDGGVDGGDVVSVIAAAIAGAMCEKVDLCCPGMERSRVLGVGDDRAACETNLRAFYGRQYSGALAEIAEGRAEFDDARLVSCLDAYREAGCTAPGVVSLSACALVLKGVLPDGVTCDNSLQCTSRECVRAASGERLCQPRKPDGQSCTRDSECKSGLCPRALLSGTCSSIIPVGGRCGGDGFWLLL